MKAYTWDEVCCEIVEWDIPREILMVSSDPRLLALLIDAYTGFQASNDYPVLTVDGTIEIATVNGITVTSYTGTFGDHDHVGGLYFAYGDDAEQESARDTKAKEACASALAEHLQEVADADPLGEKDRTVVFEVCGNDSRYYRIAERYVVEALALQPNYRLPFLYEKSETTSIHSDSDVDVVIVTDDRDGWIDFEETAIAIRDRS